jgi:hypothetical protein
MVVMYEEFLAEKLQTAVRSSRRFPIHSTDIAIGKTPSE